MWHQDMWDMIRICGTWSGLCVTWSGYVRHDPDMWDMIRICGTWSGYVGHDPDMWDMIRICGTWSGYVWHDRDMWDMIQICVTWSGYVRHDPDMWDMIRICGTWSGYVGHDQDMWDMIRICGAWSVKILPHVFEHDDKIQQQLTTFFFLMRMNSWKCGLPGWLAKSVLHLQLQGLILNQLGKSSCIQYTWLSIQYITISTFRPDVQESLCSGLMHLYRWHLGQ